MKNSILIANQFFGMTEGKNNECGICSEVATTICDSCCDSFCDSCFEFVHKTTKKTHSKYSLATPTFLPSNIKCNKHNDEKLKLWCEDCKVPICLGCHFTHPHNTKNLDEIYLQQKQDLLKRKDMIYKQLKDMEKYKTTIENNYEEFIVLFCDFLNKMKKEQLEKTKEYFQEIKKTAETMRNYELKVVYQ